MIRFAAASALVLVSLAACERRDDPVADPPSASVDPPPEAAPPGAESPPPAETVLTADGLGPVHIGMTVAEVARVWGADSNPNAVGGPDPATCDEFHPVDAPEGVNVMIQNGVLARITLRRGATVKTDRGFGLGDAGLAIKQAYGGAVFAQPHKYQPAPAEDLIAWTRGGSTDYVTDPGARGVRYEIGSDGKVAMIHAGGPAIQLVEGCA